MLSYLIRRVGYALIMIVLVSFVCFVIIELPPGDYLTQKIDQLRARGDRHVDRVGRALGSATVPSSGRTSATSRFAHRPPVAASTPPQSLRLRSGRRAAAPRPDTSRAPDTALRSSSP